MLMCLIQGAANFGELRHGEVRRIYLLRTSVNKEEGIGVYVPGSGVRRGMRMVKVDPSPMLLRTSRLPP